MLILCLWSKAFNCDPWSHICGRLWQNSLSMRSSMLKIIFFLCTHLLGFFFMDWLSVVVLRSLIWWGQIPTGNVDVIDHPALQVSFPRHRSCFYNSRLEVSHMHVQFDAFWWSLFSWIVANTFNPEGTKGNLHCPIQDGFSSQWDQALIVKLLRQTVAEHKIHVVSLFPLFCSYIFPYS